jgi:hypothetical protein
LVMSNGMVCRVVHAIKQLLLLLLFLLMVST